jgi:hypothetical protein
LFGKPEGKKPLESSRSRWEDNIKIDIRDIELEMRIFIWLSIWTSGGCSEYGRKSSVFIKDSDK